MASLIYDDGRNDLFVGANKMVSNEATNHIPDVTKMVSPELLAAARALDEYAGAGGNADAWQGVGVMSVPIRLLVDLRRALRELA